MSQNRIRNLKKIINFTHLIFGLEVDFRDFGQFYRQWTSSSWFLTGLKDFSSTGHCYYCTLTELVELVNFRVALNINCTDIKKLSQWLKSLWNSLGFLFFDQIARLTENNSNKYAQISRKIDREKNDLCVISSVKTCQ